MSKVSKEEIRDAAKAVAIAVIENPSSLPHLMEGFEAAISSNANTVDQLQCALEDLSKQIEKIVALRTALNISDKSGINNLEDSLQRPMKRAANKTVVKSESLRIQCGDVERKLKALLKDDKYVIQTIKDSFGYPSSEKSAQPNNWFRSMDLIQKICTDTFNKKLNNPKAKKRLQNRLMYTLAKHRQSGHLIRRGSSTFEIQWCLISNP